MFEKNDLGGDRMNRTVWSGGKIHFQEMKDRHGTTFIREPPWLWGATDQTEASAPWILEGLEVDDWYRQLPKSQRP